MSSVRMCDNCGTIFSEAESGWQTGSVVTVEEDGLKRSYQQDRCPECAVGVHGKRKMQPRLAAPKEESNPTA